jgi:hypothetical protein
MYIHDIMGLPGYALLVSGFWFLFTCFVSAILGHFYLLNYIPTTMYISYRRFGLGFVMVYYYCSCTMHYDL